MAKPTYDELFQHAISPQHLTAAILSGKNPDGTDYIPSILVFRWDINTLSPVPWDGAVSGGSGGGGAVTIADGANVTQGALADAAIVSDANGTLSGKLRGLVKMLADVWDSVNHRIKVDASGATVPISASSLPLPATAAKDSTLTDGSQRVGGTVGVTGTFWQGTQPVSIASMPSTPVTGTFFQSTQPVSAASLPLPSGAATDAALVSILAQVDNKTSTLATQLTLAQLLAVLNIAQGASSLAQTGPLMQATVSDSPNSFNDNTVQPLSITPEGRLRVSSAASYLDHIWQDTFNDPWGSDLPNAGDTYV